MTRLLLTSDALGGVRVAYRERLPDVGEVDEHLAVYASAVLARGGAVAAVMAGALAWWGAPTAASPAAIGAVASAQSSPVLGSTVLVAPVSGVVLVRLRGTHAFTRLLAPLDLPVGSEIDTRNGSMSVTEATGVGVAVDVATVSGGQAIVTQGHATGAPTTFRLSQPLVCGATTAGSAGAQHRVKRRHITVKENGGSWDTRAQYVATAAEGTNWTTTDTCGASTVTVRAGSVVVTNLVNHTTTTLTAGQHLTVRGGPTAHVKYTCSGGATTVVFDNWNTGGVTGGGTPPTFSTGGQPYCLLEIATYHYNNGAGAPPGTLELTSSSGAIGPFTAVGQSATGGPGNIAWIATPPSSSMPVIIDGTYTCRDSDPATWSQDSGSGGNGFCRVYAERAQAG